MKYDAFISYRRSNGFLMAQVIRYGLEERGIHCFLDMEELRSGRFDEKILQAIQVAHSFILVLNRGALNRCASEDDFVRREILAAVEFKKTIIPVMCADFSWPKEWDDGIPGQIRDLQSTNAVIGSQEYLSAMIDKIISYMPQDKLSHPLSMGAAEAAPLPLDIESFFREALERVDDIEGIDMAFHSGAQWLQDAVKVNILQNLLSRRIPLRVLVNASGAVDDIARNMRMPLKRYIPFDENLADWRRQMRPFAELVTVRAAHVPLLHCAYLVRGKVDGMANVTFYAYGAHSSDRDFRTVFLSGSPEYALFTEEFDYLWERASED